MSGINDTQTKLIHTATQLFYNKSYSTVGINEICQTAGVKKGSFYYFFSSKQVLAMSIIDNLWNDFYDGFLSMVLFEAEQPVPERFYQFFALTASKADRQKEQGAPIRGCHFGNLAVELSTQDEILRNELANVFAEWMKGFAQALEIGIERQEISAEIDLSTQAQQILVIFEGAAVLAKTFNDTQYLLSAGQLVRDMLRLE